MVSRKRSALFVPAIVAILLACASTQVAVNYDKLKARIEEFAQSVYAQRAAAETRGIAGAE